MTHCLRSLGFVASFLSLPAIAMADFVNGGFEDGLTGWTIEYGRSESWGDESSWLSTPWVTNHPPPKTVSDIVINAETFSALCGTFSAQLNNLTGGRHATRITQSTVLEEDDIGAAPCNLTELRVRWLAALVEPTNQPHDPGEQPAFRIEVRVNSSVVESFEATAGEAEDQGWLSGGMFSNNPVWFKEGTLELPLSVEVGDIVTVTMTVRDCSESAHGGMAFLDCVELVPVGNGPQLGGLGIWTSTDSGDYGWLAGDYDGDGLDDVARVEFGQIEVLPSDGASFQSPTLWASVPPSLAFFVGDFDGDGRSDLLRQPVVGGVEVLRSTGSAFDPPAVWSTSAWGTDDRWYVGDFDGDGVDDIARNMTSVSEFHVLLSTGTSFSDPDPWGVASGLFRYSVGDFDGDCGSDLMARSNTSVTYVQLSTGDAFGALDPWHTFLDGDPNESVHVGDFDGDGRDDFGWRLSPDPFFRVYTSLDGWKFQGGGAWSVIFDDPIWVGNFTGPGSEEIVRESVLHTLGTVSCNAGDGVKECASCVEVVADSLWCDMSATPLNYEVELVNRSGTLIEHIVLTPPLGVTLSPTSYSVFLPDDASVTISTEITVDTTAPDDVCIVITLHSAGFEECCSASHCFSIAEPIDGCPLVAGGSLGIDGSLFDGGGGLGPYDDGIGGVGCPDGIFTPEGLATTIFEHNQEVDPLLDPAVDDYEAPRFDPTSASPALFENGAEILNVRTLDAWFADTDFAGALPFTGGDPALDWSHGWTTFDYDGGVSRTDIDLMKPLESVSGTIATDTEWTADANVELLDRVVVPSGVTLAIEAGTAVLGHPGSSLVIEPGAYLAALGTATEPVLFTSSAILSGVPQQPGDWGGLVIRGRALTSCAGATPCSDSGVTPCVGPPEVGAYGGDDDSASSGVLRYCRIEYAGDRGAAAAGSSLGLYAVGRGTTVDHVQVHLGSGPGIEFVGGTARARHIVSTGCAGDGLSWRDGFRGRVQFGIVQHVVADADADAIDGRNHVTDFDCVPRSTPILANLTLVGSSLVPATGRHGIYLHGGTGATVLNSVVRRFPAYGLSIEDEATFANCPGMPVPLLDLFPDPDDAEIVEVRSGAFSSETSVQLRSVVVTAVSPDEPATRPELRGFWVQDVGGMPLSGLWCQTSCVPDLAPGDLVDVFGVYREEGGVSTLDLRDGIIVERGVGVVPEPIALTVDDLDGGGASTEAWESMVVQVTSPDATLDVVSHVGDADYLVADPDNPTASVRIGGRTDRSPIRPPVGAELLEVTGVWAPSSEPDAVFTVHPRLDDDLEWLSPRPAPRVELAFNWLDPVTLVFDMPVDSATVVDPANYAVPAGFAVALVIRGGEDRVDVFVSPPPPTGSTTPFDVTVSNVENVDGVAMASQTVSVVTGTNDVVFVQTPDAGGDASRVDGEFVTVTGVVVGDDTSDFVSSTGNRFYLATASGGPYSGVAVSATECPIDVRRGDVILLAGRVAEVGGETVVRELNHVEDVAGGALVPDAAMVDIPTLVGGGGEPWEGVLVQVDGVEVSDAGDGTNNWAVSVSGSSSTLSVGRAGAYTYDPAIGDAFDYIRGLLAYDGAEFVLEPRDDDDIVPSTIGIGAASVAVTRLRDASPNPFNPRTRVTFELATASRVRLTIFDAAGRLVRTLVNGDVYSPGLHGVDWDGRGPRGHHVASGVVFLRFEAGDVVSNQKLVLLK